MNTLAKSWVDTVLDLNELTLLRHLLDRPPIKVLLQAAQSTDGAEDFSRRDAGARLGYELSRVPVVWEASWYTFAADPWEAWLMHALITEENAFANIVEKNDTPSPILKELFLSDLRVLSTARALWSTLLPHVAQAGEESWQHQTLPSSPLPPQADELSKLTKALSDSPRWEECLPEMQHFYRTVGAGPFNQAGAFTWDAQTKSFSPVLQLDPVRLADLIGYTRERERVIENTERLLNGHPAHNLLLYGDRGTGKSATIKALVHAYQDRGLKLIEVPKRHLASLPTLVSTLAVRAASFILFVDDLSFEDAETEYKELKALLEGSVQAPSQNVKVYATSNRRHLIRESFADRAGMERDVRARDTLEEKLSLADRFGITVIFAAPDEQAYLEIVHGLAAQRGIDLPLDILTRKALQWAQWQNGRSARTARQFVDSL